MCMSFIIALYSGAGRNRTRIIDSQPYEGHLANKQTESNPVVHGVYRRAVCSTGYNREQRCLLSLQSRSLENSRITSSPILPFAVQSCLTSPLQLSPRTITAYHFASLCLHTRSTLYSLEPLSNQSFRCWLPGSIAAPPPLSEAASGPSYSKHFPLL
ncbi:hypothetical protein CC79DRAFT_1129228 [Sarocladium strictum]